MKRTGLMLIVAALALACPAAAQVALTPVAISGQQAAGLPEGVTYRDLLYTTPLVSPAGQVAIYSGLSSPGTTLSDEAIWVGLPGSLQLVARAGMSAPDTEGRVYEILVTPILNSSGNLAFSAHAGPTPFNGLWTGSPSSPTLAVSTGMQAAGFPDGVTHSNFWSGTIAFNDAGQIAFHGVVTGPGIIPGDNDQAIWAGAPGSLNLLARQDSPAPGADGGLFAYLQTPKLNAAGQVAFAASLVGHIGRADGVWFGTTAAVDAVAVVGDHAPGTPPGVNFGSPATGPVGFSEPALSSSGQLAFNATLVGDGIDESNDFGIWAGSPANLQLVARAGDPAPGTNTTFAGKIYDSGSDSDPTPGPPSINSAGRVAFSARLAGAGDAEGLKDWGIWAGAPGQVNLIARHGQPAPGIPGAIFGFDKADRWEELPTFRQVCINNRGQVAFTAFIAGPTALDIPYRAIYVADPNGQLQLIAATGQQLDLGNGDLRTIKWLNFDPNSSGQDGLGANFNNAGQLVFAAGFTDESSAIILATVPEPAVLPAFLLAAALLRRGRRMPS